MKPKTINILVTIDILVTIEEQNGEQEYTFHSIQQCELGKENETAENLAANWYDRDENEPAEKIDGYYEYLGGTIAARVKQWQRITAGQVKTLRGLNVA